MNIQTINHVSDCVPLFTHQSLYLKPSAKFNITVSLPEAITGKTISNWDAMESLRKMIAPDKFSVLKVSECFRIHGGKCFTAFVNENVKKPINLNYFY